MVYAIILTFASWDDCWNYYHEHASILEPHTISKMCAKIETLEPSYAPTTSIQPKARPNGGVRQWK